LSPEGRSRAGARRDRSATRSNRAADRARLAPHALTAHPADPGHAVARPPQREPGGAGHRAQRRRVLNAESRGALTRRCDNRGVAETNGELARRAFEAVLQGNLDLVSDLLAPDVKWHGGDPAAPGACHNRRQALAFIDRARERVRDVEVLDVVGA